MAFDSIWLGIAFSLGFIMRHLSLPPMLGFLAAGFVLNRMNIHHGELLNNLSDIGVSLLLFTIGLKLNIKSLTQKAIWAGGLLSSILSLIIFSSFFYLALFADIPFFNTLNNHQILLIAFALSFSSTVFVIKILEEQGTLNTAEGKIAVGVLIIQDILAVLFVTFSKGIWPSPYALLLLLTPLLRPLLIWILKKTGHGEMLILFGFFVAILGGELFELVGLKSDLGALVFGIILANHKKSDELAKNLLNFKDFFLIAFFLNIGFFGLPTAHTFIIALILAPLLLLKPIIYHFAFTRFKYPVQASYFAALSMTNYSEFGLIVGVIAAKAGLINAEWLVILALAISISFIISSMLNKNAIRIFEHKKNLICSIGRNIEPDVCENNEEASDAKVLIFGMGRIGTIIYDRLNLKFPKQIIAVDSNQQVVNEHIEKNRNVVLNDATNTEFWENICKDKVTLIVLAMPDYKANEFALKMINASQLNIKVYAAARFDDEVNRLKEAGAHQAFNLIEEAGKGIVNDILNHHNDLQKKP